MHPRWIVGYCYLDEFMGGAICDTLTGEIFAFLTLEDAEEALETMPEPHYRAGLSLTFIALDQVRA